MLESLAQGVPQVAIPVAFDQPGVAARIAHHRTGVVTSLAKLTAGHLSTLLNKVLYDSIEQSLGVSGNSQLLMSTAADSPLASAIAFCIIRALSR
jgi:hypothetical protein